MDGRMGEGFLDFSKGFNCFCFSFCSPPFLAVVFLWNPPPGFFLRIVGFFDSGFDCGGGE